MRNYVVFVRGSLFVVKKLPADLHRGSHRFGNLWRDWNGWYISKEEYKLLIETGSLPRLSYSGLKRAKYISRNEYFET